MIKIDLHNYEAYLLDLAEGNLSEAEEQALRAFLEEHPDLDATLEGETDLPHVTPPLLAFPGKQALHQQVISEGSIDASNYETYMIKEVEGLLDESEQKALQQFVQKNPALERDYRLFQQTRLTPEVISMPGKADLKRSVPVIRLVPAQVLRVAAVVAVLLASVWFVAQQAGTPSDAGMAYLPRTEAVQTPLAEQTAPLQGTSYWTDRIRKVPVERVPVMVDPVSREASVSLAATEKEIEAFSEPLSLAVVAADPLPLPTLKKSLATPVIDTRMPLWEEPLLAETESREPLLKFSLPRLFADNRADAKSGPVAWFKEKKPFSKFIRFRRYDNSEGDMEAWECWVGPVSMYREVRSED